MPLSGPIKVFAQKRDWISFVYFAIYIYAGEVISYVRPLSMGILQEVGTSWHALHVTVHVTIHVVMSPYMSSRSKSVTPTPTLPLEGAGRKILGSRDPSVVLVTASVVTAASQQVTCFRQRGRLREEDKGGGGEVGVSYWIRDLDRTQKLMALDP